ncbi:lysylphosphatidylglycerol synthase transmembrane domain-containing protein [Coprobacter tertius]|uniref:Flippase-like domain-containing protein n=1 Tax=Coprobacter tertius TaxID=2944915 RepID=A0ABT1MJT4_9BACT|nr:lysylphosphatidylglycerol synthase transmembrane domain-containing protein [Coprobacter tertius]MCP9612629.1 flippase-like domain-containing protein [Coprobacter tertius]
MSAEVKKFKSVYVLIPVIIGLVVVGIMFYKEVDPSIFMHLKFTPASVFFIFLAFLLMFGRDLGLMWRYRKVSDNRLTWRQAFRVNMLCEFTSAVTPSAVGGSSLIVVFLNREGIDAGRSTTLMITCLFLDELFFVISCLLVCLFFSFDDLFGTSVVFTRGVSILFYTIYALITLWTVFLYLALFKKPEWVRSFLNRLFSMKWLRHWQQPVARMADDLVHSSHDIAGRPAKFWAGAFGATIVSWTSRYLVVNALLLAFSSGGNHLLAFARQFVLWQVMAVSPTPGGSGLSEYMFTQYYHDFFPVVGMALVAAFLWRIITYYMYLAIGVCIVPAWLRHMGTRSDKVPESL